MNEKLKTGMHAVGRVFKKAFVKSKMSFIAIAIGLILGLIIMLILNPGESFIAFGYLFLGGFTDGFSGFATSLHRAAPIILTGLSFAFAYKAGLFNIGTPGQMAVGAVIFVIVGVKMPMPAPLHWIVGIIFAMLGGAIWGAIPGLFKAFLNVNEVVTAIMLNYIAMYSVSLLVSEVIPDPVHMTQSAPILPSAVIPSWGLNVIFNNHLMSIAILIAVAVAIIVHIVINKTTIGYEIKSSGSNIHASQYAGMKTRKNIILSMAIAGILAGLAGAIFQGERTVLIYSSPKLMTQGFDGIAVALLGLGEPIGAIFSGIFLSHLREGAYYMGTTSFSTEIVDVIMSVIIYSTSLTIGIQALLKRFRKSKKNEQSVNIKSGGDSI